MKKRGAFKNLNRALRRAVIFGTVVAFALSVSGCALFPKEEDVLPPPLTEPPKAEYDTYPAEIGTIEKKIEGTASFQSDEKYDLSYKSGGRLKAVHVKPLDTVKKGQLLIELENEGQEKDLKKQELDLKNQELDLVNTKANLSYQIDQDKLKLAELKKQLEYKSSPAMKGMVSEKELDDLKKAIKDQEAALKRSQDNYNYQMTRLTNNLTKARLDYNYNKEAFEKSRLVSPINGIVTTLKNDLRIGGWVDPNTMVAQVSNPANVLLSYNDESNIEAFQLNTKLDIEYDGKSYKGTVVKTPATLTEGGNTTLMSTVYIRIDGLKGAVKIGDSARISLIQERSENAVQIPRAYLQTPPGRTFVWVLDEKEQVKKERDVEIGINNGTMVEIKSGLKEGELVVAGN